MAIWDSSALFGQLSMPGGKGMRLSNEIPKLTYRSSNKWKGNHSSEASEASAFFRCHVTGVNGCVGCWVQVTPGHPNLERFFLLSSGADVLKGSAPSPSQDFSLVSPA